jgi:lysozyme
MLLRRVVALAQALTMILLLAPGPHPGGPASVQAAVAPPQLGAVDVFDASGKGIGCQAGTRKYKGPGLPKDPPWPPGAEPTPSPTPEPSPEPSASAEAAEPDASDEPTAEVPMAFLAAEVEVPVAETSEPTAEPSAEPSAEPTPRPKGSRFLQGIDVSRYQDTIDFKSVRDADRRFVFLKATESNDRIDPLFATNIASARESRLAVGGYHVFDYTIDGKVQADHFVDRLEAQRAVNGALPPVVDVECWSYRGSSNHTFSTTRLQDFIKQVYARTGRMPMVYTSTYMWRQVMGDAEGFDDLRLWAACWDCEAPPNLAAGWDDWTFWQTTSRARVAGISGPVDDNFFNGKRKDLEALKLRPFKVAGGAATAGGEVELDLGGRDATHVRTSPDGESWSEWARVRSVPTATIPTKEGEYTVFAQFRNGPGLRSPVVSDSIFVDATAPDVTPPVVALRLGALASGAASLPVTVSWDARDVHAGLVGGAVLVACGADRNERTDAPGSARPDEAVTWNADAALFPDATCDVTAISEDGAGNRGRASVAGLTTSVFPAGAAERASALLTGQQAGVIAQRGPDAGRISVAIDGQTVGLVDLYAPEPSGPELVYVLPLPAGSGEVSVDPTGTADPASAGTRVVIDGLVSLGTDA